MTRKMTKEEINLLEKEIQTHCDNSEKNIEKLLDVKIDYTEEEFSNIHPKVDSEEQLEFRRDGVNAKDLKKLKDSNGSIETLDLHGVDSKGAQALIADFITKSLQKDQTRIRIIHGKSVNKKYSNYPIIKNIVNNMLQKIPQVLAFCSSNKYYGGTGSLNVLLQSKRRNHGKK